MEPIEFFLLLFNGMEIEYYLIPIEATRQQQGLDDLWAAHGHYLNTCDPLGAKVEAGLERIAARICDDPASCSEENRELVGTWVEYKQDEKKTIKIPKAPTIVVECGYVP